LRPQFSGLWYDTWLARHFLAFRDEPNRFQELDTFSKW
jgi:hypothetical protein